RLWFTKCSAGTAKAGEARPGSAPSAVGISAFLRSICHMACLQTLVLHQYGHTLPANRGGGDPGMAVFFICAGVLGLLTLVLATNISRLRRGRGISLGNGGHKDVEAAIRAHGNLIEWAPLVLLLIYLLHGPSGDRIVAILAIVFTLGRLAHAGG